MTVTHSEQCKCSRWAVSLSHAFENAQLEKLFRKGVQCITQEEFDKLSKMRHREDSLAALYGRLLLREGVRKFTDCEWDEVTFGRTERGKPYIVTPESANFGINISHQGNYVAFASSCSPRVGVDVMRLDKERNNKSADEYINSMAKSASVEELKQMRSQPTEAMKMVMFYRYWCLKEAILKATGEGIMQDLNRLDFRCDFADRYKQGCFITSTSMLEDGKVQRQWIFEESFIDNNHSAAVCKEKRAPSFCTFSKDSEAKIFFSKVGFESLLDHATIINPLPQDGLQAWEDFCLKPRKMF
ncbi:hypothetical protein PRIPAC_96996 [Pristionchus pacificus]|nr:hypothetical protein PRIPAC_96996 [Pristionchus pacificus]